MSSLDKLIPVPQPRGERHEWGTVTSTIPLQVTLDGETQGIYVTSNIAGPVSTGSRVLLLISGWDRTIIGPNYSVDKRLNAQSQIVRIANIANRAAAVAGRSGRPITQSDPLLVWRADAESGSELEVTTNGTTWGRAAAGYVESWGQRSSSIGKTTSAGGATATILLLALTVTIPVTGRYVVTAGATIAPAGNAAGTVSLTDDTVTRSQDYHSQSSTVPVPIWVSFARSYNAGQVVGVGLRVTPSGGSVATDHYNKWATIERLT